MTDSGLTGDGGEAVDGSPVPGRVFRSGGGQRRRTEAERVPRRTAPRQTKRRPGGGSGSGLFIWLGRPRVAVRGELGLVKWKGFPSSLFSTRL